MSKASKNSNLICRWDYIPINNLIHAADESKVAEIKGKVFVQIAFQTSPFYAPTCNVSCTHCCTVV